MRTNFDGTESRLDRALVAQDNDYRHSTAGADSAVARMNRCLEQLREWARVGYVRSRQETYEWLRDQGVADAPALMVLDQMGFV